MELLSVFEAAKALRVSERTVYRLLDSGGLMGTRVGSRWRIPTASVRELVGRRLVEPHPEVEAAASAAIHAVLQRVVGEGFRHYFCEDDLNADLANELRARLSPDAFEIHHKLDTAGSAGRGYPDLSVIPRMDGLADRRGSAAYLSLEIRFYSYRGDWGPYRLRDRLFSDLLSDLEGQFQRLTERTREWLLGSGAVLWIDAFDWRRRCPEDERHAVIAERAEWVRSHLAAPESRVRIEYLPIFSPDRRVGLLNGFPAPGPEQVSRPRGSLLGAAVPFIRRMPAPDEDWDELVAQAAAEDWRAKMEP
jgi:excisionase family DNA binding protein